MGHSGPYAPLRCTNFYPPHGFFLHVCCRTVYVRNGSHTFLKCRQGGTASFYIQWLYGTNELSNAGSLVTKLVMVCQISNFTLTSFVPVSYVLGASTGSVEHPYVEICRPVHMIGTLAKLCRRLGA